MRDSIENISQLQKQLNALQLENQMLKNILDNAGLSYHKELSALRQSDTKEAYAQEQGKRIIPPPVITENMANQFFGMFWGRQDVYAKRSVTVGSVKGAQSLTSKALQKKYLGIESDIIKQQRVRNKNNDFSSEISYAKRTEKKEIEEIMDDVRENDQCLFYVGVTIILMADSKNELDSITETVETIGKRNSCTIDVHYLKQREALNTALPIGVRQVETMRTMLTQSLAVLMPFNVQELNDEGGVYYGINQVSKNINIGNRKKLINGNGFVFGVPGD